MGNFNSSFSYVLIYIFSINDRQHKDCLKIGQTTIKTDIEDAEDKLFPNSKLLNKAAHKRIQEYTRTAGVEYKLEHTELAIRKSNDTGKVEYFTDNAIHRVLMNSSIKKVKFSNGGQEWFKVNLPTAINAIQAVKDYRISLSSDEFISEEQAISFRPEQEEALQATIKQFKTQKEMLWNAKMRFGKTLVSLGLVKRQGYKKTIIITHRPVVKDSWREDFYKIFNKDTGYYFSAKDADKDTNLLQYCIDKDVPFVHFASIQDLRGSEIVGGYFSKNDLVFQTDWDLVIIDEAHEGTLTKLGEDVKKAIIKENSKVLYLSGTPFNLVDDFPPEQIYTWDYVMEQRAKYEWNIKNALDSNPYENLPTLEIYTYDLGEKLRGYIETEDNAFNFTEFFRTWTGDIQNDRKVIPAEACIGDFVHHEDVNSFINLLINKDDNSNYPFSKDEYRNYFRHTLWVLPGVKEAKALSKLLKEHEVFSNFKIVNVAGEGDEEEPFNDALEKVKNAITSNPEETYTITLSCGRLTTGVSVPPWTAVFMLSGTYSTSATSYLQTIFRVQTPANINGKIKDKCYVFDFAPDRTLKMIAEAGKLGIRPGDTSSNSKIMGDFLNFCPVISVLGSEMKPYDVNSMLQQLKRVYADKVVKSGFTDTRLYNDNLLKIDELDIKEFEKLKTIVSKNKANDLNKNIVINNQGLTDEEHEEFERIKNRRSSERTEEDKKKLEQLKKANEERIKAIKILRAISIRIPMLIYGMDGDFDSDITLDDFIKKVDDISWNEFMPAGVTKEVFKKFKKYYDKDIFIAAGKRVRANIKGADELTPLDRIKRIAEIFSTFKNPDKETVLTPWRVVNMHLGDCLGGYDFYDEDNIEMLSEPEYHYLGDVTDNTVSNVNAKILEINSKSGLYPLYVTYSIFRKRLDMYSEEEQTPELIDNLWNKTVSENIFVICKTPMAKMITKRTLLGFKQGNLHAHYFEDLINQFKNRNDKVVSKIKSPDYWKIEGIDEMKFDAIIGNPPYQENIENRGEQPPIYHLFYDAAMEISEYVSFITPARFLFDVGKTPTLWNRKMLNDKHFKVINYFPNSTEIFNTVDIKGGVAITSWNKKEENTPIEIFNPNETIKQIIDKVKAFNEHSFSDIMFSNTSYKYSSKFFEENKDFNNRVSGGSKRYLSSSCFDKFPEAFIENVENEKEYYKIIGRQNSKRVSLFIKKDYIIPPSNFSNYKLVLPSSNGSGFLGEVISDPFVGIPYIGFTETFVTFGNFENEEEANNSLKYIKTKFARLMLGTKKVTQGNKNIKVWGNVPIQDFTKQSDIDWSKSIKEIDEQLYKKYNLTCDEIDFIEQNIKPME